MTDEPVEMGTWDLGPTPFDEVVRLLVRAWSVSASRRHTSWQAALLDTGVDHRGLTQNQYEAAAREAWGRLHAPAGAKFSREQLCAMVASMPPADPSVEQRDSTRHGFDPDEEPAS